MFVGSYQCSFSSWGGKRHEGEELQIVAHALTGLVGSSGVGTIRLFRRAVFRFRRSGRHCPLAGSMHPSRSVSGSRLSAWIVDLPRAGCRNGMRGDYCLADRGQERYRRRVYLSAAQPSRDQANVELTKKRTADSTVLRKTACFRLIWCRNWRFMDRRHAVWDRSKSAEAI